MILILDISPYGGDICQYDWYC